MKHKEVYLLLALKEKYSLNRIIAIDAVEFLKMSYGETLDKKKLLSYYKQLKRNQKTCNKNLEELKKLIYDI